jgi:hypothetical protein
MNINTIVTFCGLVLSIVLGGCNENQRAQKPDQNFEKEAPLLSGWQRITTDTWSLDAPPDWTVDTEGISGAELVMAPPAESEDDSFYETINLTIIPIENAKMNLDSFLALNLETMMLYLPNWELEERNPVNMSGLPAVQLIYSGVLQSYSMRWCQWYALKDHEAWVLTLAAEQRRYPIVAPTADLVFKSFRFKESGN